MMGGVPQAISISGLVKTFGSTRALDGLDLSVEAGEVHGFLRPTGVRRKKIERSIRVLLGLSRRGRRREAAFVWVDPWRDAVALHRRLAYMPARGSVGG